MFLQLQGQIDAKAGLTQTTAALATKADAAQTTAALPTKGDAAQTTAALATKADTAQTTAALAGKVDSSTFNEANTQRITADALLEESIANLNTGLAGKQPTIAEGSLSQSKVTNLVADLGAKALQADLVSGLPARPLLIGNVPPPT